MGGGGRAGRAGDDPRRRPDRVLPSRSTPRTSAGRSCARIPDWHFWPTRPPGAPTSTGFPPFDELIDGARSAWSSAIRGRRSSAPTSAAPRRTWRGCRTILERCPNFHVDLAARIAELGRQPSTARAFIERWADRVLFGTDMAPDPRWYAVYYRFLETRDESFPYDADPDAPPSQGRWRIHGLDLPDDVLRTVYRENALRLIRF